ncbi:MAG: carboxypeptidase regulatory-like domain-containing protein [Acidobacteria bacterium]|nr:carboxypeptidase regulatory-like domain-containing protein [Acidobacteriota bacterium]
MLKTIVVALLPLLIFFENSAEMSLTNFNVVRRDANTGTMKKMIVARGNVSIDLDMDRLNGSATKDSSSTQFRFEAEPDSFFTVLVFNDELRGPIPSSMTIIAKDSALPGRLNSANGQLAVENLEPTEPYELAVRDPRTGFTFFYVEGHLYDYYPSDQTLYVQMGRLILSKEYATELGRPGDALATVGQISITATMRPVEVTRVVDGEVKSESMPGNAFPGTTPGPDVVVGDVNGLAQFGSQAGTQVGLALGTDSCNFGNVDLNWFALPDNDHPVIPQNLYRLSGGASNDERFEQIAQSQVKHAFTALTNNICSLGCNGVGGTRLGSGCSDPYSASLNAGPNLGSKAWINPYTGFYPRGDAATPPNNHSGHTHTGPSHRMLTEVNDLNTSLNAGATYYAEGQYVTPHEYAWCQANPTQCNMNNNVSYRRYSVTGTASPFSFSAVGSTVRQKAAINAWTGATLAEIRPAPTADGIGIVGYKVTNPSPGVWHYEYAIYNQNLDRAIQSFSVPIGGGATLTNVGFKAPPQHPAWANDGTVGSAGFSNAAWTQAPAANSMTWSSETLAQNPNANAIRWGTLYNFRFDSDRAPQTVNATVGFFKTGSPITVSVQAPSGPAVAVSVSGRVTSSTGQSVSMARVTMTDGNGVTRTALTNPFGYYRFLNVTSGASYTMGARSKEYTFTSRAVQVNDNVTNADFVAQ